MLDVDYEYFHERQRQASKYARHRGHTYNGGFDDNLQFDHAVLCDRRVQLSPRIDLLAPDSEVIVAALLISLFIRLFTMRAGRLGEAIVRAHQKLYRTGICRTFRSHARDTGFRARGTRGAAVRRCVSGGADGHPPKERNHRAAYPLLEVLGAGLLIGVVLLGVSINLGMPTLLVFLVLFYRLQPHIRGIDHNRVLLASLAAGVRDVTDRSRRQAVHAIGRARLSSIADFNRVSRGLFQLRHERSPSRAMSGRRFKTCRCVPFRRSHRYRRRFWGGQSPGSSIFSIVSMTRPPDVSSLTDIPCLNSTSRHGAQGWQSPVRMPN